MGKHKKKKKKEPKYSLISELDRDLMSQYDNMIEDIETYQYQIYLADKKTKKKNKKKHKKGCNDFYSVKPTIKARKKIVKDMEEKGYPNRFLDALGDVGPVVKLLGRLLAALLLAILSIDSVKKAIKPETLGLLDKVFSVAVSV